MSLLTGAPYVAIIVPFAVAALLAAGVRVWGRAAPWLALAGPLSLLAVGASCVGGGASGSVTWLRAGASVLRVGYACDPLAALMLLVVGGVAACVMVYSIGYMRGDRGFVRYYAILSLFVGAMALLVMASDLVTLFVGWEMVGTCSFLLIGFWYQRPAAAEAARKAFLVTRVGDAAMLLGMGVLWRSAGTLELSAVFAKLPSFGPGVTVAAALLVLAGAAGKSAQFPLHIWLPDAMEGPTPVSALIHAATMVASGVFLVARVWPLFAAAPAARQVALIAGAVTALGAAGAALAQTDIKKVLAYSTISQLGFMFAALGVGAWQVAMFHLVTHAAFKALLFLAAGSVIHGSGTQELGEMGGLGRRMPVTTVAWIAGAVSLAGVFPAAGFFSKDEVVASVLHAAPWAGIVLLAAGALTACYAARTTRLAFFGRPRTERHAHEAPVSMTGPLVVLAVVALVLGAAGGAIGTMLGARPEPLSVAVAGLALALAAVGGVGGWVTALAPTHLHAVRRAVAASARAGWGVDAAVSRFIVAPITAMARFTDAMADRLVIDGLAEGVASAAVRIGAWMTEIQSGDGQWYASLMVTGVVLLVAAVAWLAR